MHASSIATTFHLSLFRQSTIAAWTQHHRQPKHTCIWDVKPGILGLEAMLPLLSTQVNEGKLALSDLVRMISETPAEIFNLKDRGSLDEGYLADLVVVEIHRKHKIDSYRFLSKAKYSPFDEWKAKGKPIKTFVNGQLVMDEGEIVTKPGTGQIIRRMK